MSTMDIISQLHSMSEQELVTVNSALVDQLKAVRRRKSATARHMFSVGDRVGFGEVGGRGKRGYKVGELTRIKRTRAEVKVDHVTWTVPLNMLTAA